MSNEEIIKNLTAYMYYALGEMPKQAGEAISAAISALRQQKPAENKPLTLEELREMDGKPAWIEDIDKKQHYGKYGGYGQISVWGNGSLEDISVEAICEAPHGHTCWEENSYGKTWIAYRQKPVSK